MVQVDCGKCKRHEHSHSVFCQANKKHVAALNKVKGVLRTIAAEARAETMAVRRASQ